MSAMLVFDGDCGFCSRYASWVEARLPPEIEVVPWQRVDDLSELGLRRPEVECAAWWVADGGRWGGGEAIARSLMAIGGLWRWIGRLMLTRALRRLTQVAYRWVAANRHRFAGATPACGIDADRPDR